MTGICSYSTRARLVAAATAGSLLAVAPAAAQTDSARAADSARARRMERVVVIAQRAEAPLAASAAAVTRLDADALRRLPARTVAEALQFVPGIAVLQADGLGDAPRLAVRGFYGGGETEYVTVLLDGVPLTGLAAGTVNWDLVPLTSVQAIEVVRGGASSLYGDAAVGGVVNLITRRDADSYAVWRVTAGELGAVRGGGVVGGRAAGGRRVSLFGDIRRSDGYRAHERRDAETVGGSVALAEGAGGGGSLSLSLLAHRRAFDEPGPLTSAAVAASRRASSPFYRFDHTREQLQRLSLDGTRVLGARAGVKGYLVGEYARADAVRTLPLSPEFADTKARAAYTTRVLGSLQAELAGLLPGGADRLVVGTDVAAGRIRSAYDAMLFGGEQDYASAPASVPRTPDSRGRGRRTAAAAFASWELAPAEALRLTLGSRLDWIEDRYEPRPPSEGAATRSTNVAFSPRAGANLRYLNGGRQTGHLYATAGRSFKAPTMDQLFDQRTTPVEFPPYAITVSNPLLRPQYGVGVEAGAYHSVGLVPERLSARLALSAYQMDMEDELDFSFESFRYVNLGKSRHRGVEAGLALSGPAGTGAFLNYTQQDATSRFGDNSGRFLKTIPRRVWAAGVARSPRRGLAAGLTATSVRDAFLDDANAIPIENYTRLDARASYPLLGVRLSVDVRNVLGREYSSTGFPDPSGGDVRYFYPAAGRVVIVGVESGW